MENIEAYTKGCRAIGIPGSPGRNMQACTCRSLARAEDYNFASAALWDASNLKQVPLPWPVAPRHARRSHRTLWP